MAAALSPSLQNGQPFPQLDQPNKMRPLASIFSRELQSKTLENFVGTLERGVKPKLSFCLYEHQSYEIPILNHIVAEFGDEALDLIKVLLGKGIDINHTDSVGETVLEVASKRGAVKVVSLLLARPTIQLTRSIIKQIGEKMELAFSCSPKDMGDKIEGIRKYINDCIPFFNRTLHPKDKLPTIEKFEAVKTLASFSFELDSKSNKSS